MTPSLDPLRWALLLGLCLAYAAVCLAPWWRGRKRRAAAQDESGTGAVWVVAYASQTGNAEELAGQTAALLRLAGIRVRLCSLSELGMDELMRSERMLFLVSTYGEGDAPDNAAAFCSRYMTAGLSLAHLHYAVLALGDSQYKNYCGFGRALDQWLAEQGARALFDRIEVDRSALPAIAQWQQRLSHLAGTSDAPDWSAPAYGDWRLARRQLLNPGSAGAPAYHLELEPVGAPSPHWQSGDLVQLCPPDDPDSPRDYSIASLPSDGSLHLLVRLQLRDDGSQGLASGWLGVTAAIGDTIPLRLRAHRGFRLEDNAARPLILIGNGSGIAGLRAHLKARERSGQKRNWLIFGERNAERDYHYREEIEHWQATQLLTRLDLAFSRDQPERRYVQDCLGHQADLVRHWMQEGAACYVCGSLSGMAAGVDSALSSILGRHELNALGACGRYRRDVY
jgi:sulfite reductase (NADPH) flavoprotein alpha-component